MLKQLCRTRYWLLAMKTIVSLKLVAIPRCHPHVRRSLDHMWAIRRWWTGLDLETYSLPNALDSVSQTDFVRGMLKCLFHLIVCRTIQVALCIDALKPDSTMKSSINSKLRTPRSREVNLKCISIHSQLYIPSIYRGPTTPDCNMLQTQPYVCGGVGPYPHCLTGNFLQFF